MASSYPSPNGTMSAMTCPVCNESEGHAAECPYPESWAGRMEQVNQAARNLGRAFVRDWQRMIETWRR